MKRSIHVKQVDAEAWRIFLVSTTNIYGQLRGYRGHALTEALELFNSKHQHTPKFTESEPRLALQRKPRKDTAAIISRIKLRLSELDCESGVSQEMLMGVVREVTGSVDPQGRTVQKYIRLLLEQGKISLGSVTLAGNLYKFGEDWAADPPLAAATSNETNSEVVSILTRDSAGGKET